MILAALISLIGNAVPGKKINCLRASCRERFFVPIKKIKAKAATFICAKASIAKTHRANSENHLRKQPLTFEKVPALGLVSLSDLESAYPLVIDQICELVLILTYQLISSRRVTNSYHISRKFIWRNN